MYGRSPCGELPELVAVTGEVGEEQKVGQSEAGERGEQGPIVHPLEHGATSCGDAAEERGEKERGRAAPICGGEEGRDGERSILRWALEACDSRS